MVKRINCLFVLLILIFTISGCNTNKKFTLEVDASVNNLQYISKGELTKKIEEKDNFVLLIVDISCSICNFFKTIVEEIISEKHIVLYAIDSTEEGFKSDNSLLPFNSTPTVAIMKAGKLVNKVDYLSDDSIFTSETNFLKHLKKYVNINEPKNEAIDSERLQMMIDSKRTFIVYFMRPTCGDCNDFNKYYLDKFNVDNPTKYYFTFDLDPYRPTASKTEEPELYQEQLELYDKIKDQFGLSVNGNEQYGYKTGVVPTFQYYESGVLSDMCVIYNDTVTGNADEITVTASYFADAPFIGEVYQRKDDTTTAYHVYKKETTDFYAQKLELLFANLY